jgi:hypothetical protein
VGFLERDFERDHLAEKSNRTKMGPKIHCAVVTFEAKISFFLRKLVKILQNMLVKLVLMLILSPFMKEKSIL